MRSCESENGCTHAIAHKRLEDAVECMLTTYVNHGRRRDRGTDDGVCVGRMLTDAWHVVL